MQPREQRFFFSRNRYVSSIHGLSTGTLRNVSSGILLLLRHHWWQKFQKLDFLATYNGAITIVFQEKHYIMY